MAKPTLAELRGASRGQVIAPDDADYEAARRVYNGMIDRRPRVVVRAVDTADVMTAINYARENALDLSIRGGSHSVPGLGTNDG
ncbi:MAG: oxidoreductase, partial [Thermoanaerobaculia bacterium]|nr:oxidoreductase [Thermoanaerobaculia bacterium]